jgi:hypothetical protein
MTQAVYGVHDLELHKHSLQLHISLVAGIPWGDKCPSNIFSNSFFFGYQVEEGKIKKKWGVSVGKECMYIMGLVQTNIPPLSNLAPSQIKVCNTHGRFYLPPQCY